jgi:hypothetical protein
MATVNAHGPIFDGRAELAVRDFIRAAEDEIAEEGAEDVRAELDVVLKHPTGYYRSHITDTRRGSRVTVNDSGVIYGHWLEGTGSRNYPKTRFKGYSTFRRTTQVLQAKAVPIAERVLPQYLRRMG